MAKTSLIYEATDALGKKIQKTFTDVNPEATSAELKTFVQMCNGLTNNTYVRTDRVNKINCDTEDTGYKPIPTLTVGDFEKVDIGYRATYTYNGDGVICLNASSTGNLPYYYISSTYIFLAQGPVTTGTTITFTATATATANYAPPATFTRTFTWEG